MIVFLQTVGEQMRGTCQLFSRMEGLNYLLKEHHRLLIRIGTNQHFIKGKLHILMDFVDPCDRVSTLLWYEDREPFYRHDFKQSIPNPATQTKAFSDH